MSAKDEERLILKRAKMLQPLNLGRHSLSKHFDVVCAAVEARVRDQAPAGRRFDSVLMLRAKELAIYLGIPKQRISEWTAAGLIPSYSFGYMRWYDYDEVIEEMKRAGIKNKRPL